MSIVICRFEVPSDNVIVELEWDKYEPHYIVNVLKGGQPDHIAKVLSKFRTGDKEAAEKAFDKEVRFARKGKYKDE